MSLPTSVSVSPLVPSRPCYRYLCPLSGYVFVDFSSEEEVKKALKCNREYMGKGVQVRCRPGPLVPPSIDITCWC